MKKIILLLLSLSLAAMAQKPKVAVGAIGDEPKNFKALKGLSTRLTEAIVNSGEYTAVDRSEEILKQLGKEHKYQRGGAVNDEQIKELGKQFSVQYMCIVGSSELKAGEYQLSARLVDVETAEITSMGSELSSLKDTKELMRVAEVLAKKLLGSDASSVQIKRVINIDDIRRRADSLQAGGLDTRDGKQYKTVKIGSQIWMAENLNYAASGSKCYDKTENCVKYGRLYDWHTAMNACPSGWHLPKDNEWNVLMAAVDGIEMAGRKLKAKSGWYDNGNGTDEFGFSALPGGYGDSDSKFKSVGDRSYWWSADHSYYYNYGYYWFIDYSGENVKNGNKDNSSLLSVRCVRD